MEIALTPIGEVSSPVKEKMRHGWGEVESIITLRPDLSESLDGIEEFSHIEVIFWIHKSAGEPPVRVHPQRREDMPLVGVLATRSPHRPNSIGLSRVELIKRSGNVLYVKGLDAIDGTPVLDIKPYLPLKSNVKVRLPEWVAKLRRK